MAAGKRPVPFRTRKLSPPAPMVLPPGGSGRVGYRRPNNFTQAPATQHHRCAAGAFHMRGPNPPGWTPHCGQQQERQLWVLTHKTRGVTTQQGAYCGKVEYRTSSTPTYTDELDLHYSTNNAPTTTRGRPRPRIADNKSQPHDWCTPTNYRAGPHSALRTTPATPIIGSHSRIAGPGTPSARHPTNRRVIKQPPRPFSSTTPGNRGARAPRGSSWSARRGRSSCGRAPAWTTDPGGSISGPR